MKAPPLAKNYKALTPEERFRLILAASGRGDEAEAARLVNAGGRITLSVPDHSPYAHAFSDLALMTFIDLLEEAASYQEAFAFADSTGDINADEAEEEERDEAAEETGARGDKGPVQEDADKEPVWLRALDVALAAGYMLRTKANGWKLFCERLNVPPFLLWEVLPGFQACAAHSGIDRESRIRSRGVSAVDQSRSPQGGAGVDRCSVNRRGSGRRD
jgi:hypothetical protein